VKISNVIEVWRYGGKGRLNESDMEMRFSSNVRYSVDIFLTYCNH
jgi:hypothetical protein